MSSAYIPVRQRLYSWIRMKVVVAQTTSCSNLSFAGSSQSGMRKRRKRSPNSLFKTVDKGLTEDTLTLNCKSCKATLVELKNKNMELNNKLLNTTKLEHKECVFTHSVCKYSPTFQQQN